MRAESVCVSLVTNAGVGSSSVSAWSPDEEDERDCLSRIQYFRPYWGVEAAPRVRSLWGGDLLYQTQEWVLLSHLQSFLTKSHRHQEQIHSQPEPGPGPGAPAGHQIQPR